MLKSLPSPKRLPSARLLEAGLRAGKCQMNVKVQKWILKSQTLNLFQGKVQNDIFVMPNLFRHLVWPLDLI